MPPARMTTAISEVHVDKVIVRGGDLCQDFIGKVGFTEYFLLLLTGIKPDEKLTRITDACLVAIAEHGFVPSVQVARMTIASSPEALQGAVAAGLLGCGSVILGASEVAGKLLLRVRDDARTRGGDFDAAAVAALQEMKAARAKLPGFGHPHHVNGDPRCTRLIEAAREIGIDGECMAALAALERNLEPVYGRWLPANVSAGIPAVLLDAGYPAGSLKGVPLLARTASLIAHLAEEAERNLGFRLAKAVETEVHYEPS